MALESRWVDAIHTRLLVRYGTRWVNLWAGIPEDAVKADWANELHGLKGDAISHALEHLPPEFPPTVAQFKALALNRAEPMPKMLPATKADPERVKGLIETALSRLQERKPLAWAYELQEREKSGEVVSPAQRGAWRSALAGGMDTSIGGIFTPVPENALPPAMRGDA